MAIADDQRFCTKCKRTLSIGQFYTYKDKTKTEQCKKCMTMHIDNYNPETFLWLLERMDVPYIAAEWNTLRDRAQAKNGQKPLTGMSVFGKYLSKMKLKQWNQYGWADTELLMAEQDNKMEVAVSQGDAHPQEELERMYREGEISEAEFLTLSDEPMARPPADEGYYPANSPFEQIELVDMASELTEEDKMYLAMKWGRLYKPNQWIALEKLYDEYMQSFDIVGAARIDTLKKLCKTSLKMDEAIDCNDVDGYQKLSRVYDSLSKAGKFQEVQNKGEQHSFVDSIGELVAICEKEKGFLPRFEITTPQDIVDRTIMDMNKYVHKLVTDDMGLGQQIEDAIAKIKLQREMEEDEESAILDDIEEAEQAILDDADLEDFYDEVRIQKEFDLEAELLSESVEPGSTPETQSDAGGEKEGE